MDFKSFIQPKTCEIGGREFTISLLPAFTAKKVYQEVVKTIQDNGEIGKTMLSDDIVKILFAHAAVVNDKCENEVLSLPSVIEKYLVKYSDFIDLTVKMLDYNFSFLTDGSLRNLLGLPAEAEEQE